MAEVWRRGSVIRSWLVDLMADALARSPGLEEFARASFGLRRRPVDGARLGGRGIPAPVITASLYERFKSRRSGEFTDKMLAAMRSEFGGHAEKKA